MEFVGLQPVVGHARRHQDARAAAAFASAIGGNDFFSQLFGGGSSGGASIRAYGLNVYRGGKQIDPDSVNWSKADVRNYSFVQPPGGKNPLGIVKFRFPNKHDVYMHDTIERELFGQSQPRAVARLHPRAEPEGFAAVMLTEGNGYNEQQVANAIAGGGEIHLDYKIPVHMTYFTAVADETERSRTYADIYGHDGKLVRGADGAHAAARSGRRDVVFGWWRRCGADRGRQQAGVKQAEEEGQSGARHAGRCDLRVLAELIGSRFKRFARRRRARGKNSQGATRGARHALLLTS